MKSAIPYSLASLATAAALLFGLLLAAGAGAVTEEGTLAIQVVDDRGRPVAGVAVLVTCPAYAELRLELATDGNGRFQATVLDAAQAYTFRLEKEGHETLTTGLQPVPRRTLRTTLTLPREGRGGQSEASRPRKTRRALAGRAPAAYNEGIQALDRGDLPEAQRKLEAAVEAGPRFPPALSALAGLYVDQGRYAEALELAERAFRIEPSDAETLGALYQARHALGQAEGAAEALEALARLGGDRNAAAHLYNEGADALNGGQLGLAERKFEAALALDSGLLPARMGLLAAAFNGRRWGEAAAAAAAILNLEPGNRKAAELRYQAYRALGDREGTLFALDALAGIDAAAAAQRLYLEALQRDSEGDDDGARRILQRLLEIDPDNARGHLQLGEILARTGSTGEAAQHLRRFLQLAPDDSEAPAATRLLSQLPPP